MLFLEISEVLFLIQTNASNVSLYPGTRRFKFAEDALLFGVNVNDATDAIREGGMFLRKCLVLGCYLRCRWRMNMSAAMARSSNMRSAGVSMRILFLLCIWLRSFRISIL